MTVTPAGSAPTTEDLITLFDLRERVDVFLDQACNAWLQARVATDPDFAYVRWPGWVEDYNRDHVCFEYYADQWAHNNYQTSEARIPWTELVPDYAEVQGMLAALTRPRPSLVPA